LSADARKVIGAQALRAFAYGLGTVLLGVTLDDLGVGAGGAGMVLAAVVGGTVVASLAVARWADRVGRRACYAGLYVGLAGAGIAFAWSRSVWLLAAVALTGTLSTEVVESGPFTSLEQAMLATELAGRERLRGFGLYNAVATAAGSLGALAAALPGAARQVWAAAPPDQRWFVLFVPVALAGAVVATTLSPSAEAPRRDPSGPPASRSRPVVMRLATLFAVDSFAGGFAVQAFIAFWLARRFDAGPAAIGAVFFAMGILQTVSFLAAVPLGERFGLLPTMVFTHLPSNVLLAALAFAPSFSIAVGILFARVLLSQMDVPARQAYVMTLVDPAERTAAATTTNLARYVARPFGPALAGAAASIALGAPFVIAGTVKIGYDLVLWTWFRAVELPEEAP
jgi:MFS family permease